MFTFARETPWVLAHAASLPAASTALRNFSRTSSTVIMRAKSHSWSFSRCAVLERDDDGQGPDRRGNRGKPFGARAGTPVLPRLRYRVGERRHPGHDGPT